MSKKICFLTGTRADFGKLKSLMSIIDAAPEFKLQVFVTGMHLNPKYGRTVDEVKKSGFRNIIEFINHSDTDYMDRTLGKTIDGFSHYIASDRPDLIVVHGDRPEALAGAIVGSMNNILTAHIEGGELSGTIDELIRHAVTKMSHIHFVANKDASLRLIQLGENKEHIYQIGSPDYDIMCSDTLPTLEQVKSHYEISFKSFSIVLFHPVTTESETTSLQASELVDALLDTDRNYIVIYPNNDMGSAHIIREYERLKNRKNFLIFPSIRFEAFIVLLSSAEFIIGNSSAGIREAPFCGTPTIDIGSRQKNRASFPSIVHSLPCKSSIMCAIETALKILSDISPKQQMENKDYFGVGQSDKKFLSVLKRKDFWKVSLQKQLIPHSVLKENCEDKQVGFE